LGTIFEAPAMVLWSEQVGPPSGDFAGRTVRRSKRDNSRVRIHSTLGAQRGGGKIARNFHSLLPTRQSEICASCGLVAMVT
jgi:hypothetical protein